MEIFNTLKNTFATIHFAFKKTSLDHLASEFVLIPPAQAKESQRLLEDKPLASFDSKEVIKLKKTASAAPIVNETRVYCVVNKYNELVKASSRLIYSPSIKAKPIYCLFLSKHDALDFLYKVAYSHPSSFKKSGLGINSFSLKQYFDIAKKNKLNADIVLLNDLQEIESLLHKSKRIQGNFKFVINKKVDFSQPTADILAYRLNPYDKGNSFSSLVFLKIDDALDFWRNTEKITKKRPIIELFPIAPFELENAIFTKNM